MKKLAAFIIMVLLFSASIPCTVTAYDWNGVSGARGNVDAENGITLYFNAVGGKELAIIPYPATGLSVFCAVSSVDAPTSFIAMGYTAFSFVPPKDNLYIGSCIRDSSSSGSGLTLLAVFPQSFFGASATEESLTADAVCTEDLSALTDFMANISTNGQ